MTFGGQDVERVTEPACCLIAVRVPASRNHRPQGPPPSWPEPNIGVIAVTGLPHRHGSPGGPAHAGSGCGFGSNTTTRSSGRSSSSDLIKVVFPLPVCPSSRWWGARAGCQMASTRSRTLPRLASGSSMVTRSSG